MRRALFRVAFAALALYGCAAVLGIDDLPEPGDDGGGDARTDSTSPADATPGNDAGADADAAVVSVVDPRSVIVIQPTFDFDPSAVVWSVHDDALYIADNALHANGNTIWKWNGIDAGLDNGRSVPVTALQRRFGQILRLLDGSILVSAYAPNLDGGLSLFTPSSATPSLIPNGSSFGLSQSPGGSIFVLTNFGGTALRLATVEEQSLSVTKLTASPPKGSVGIVVRDEDNVFVATGAGQLVVYPKTASVSSDPIASIPDAGYLIDGPDGSLLVGSGPYVLVVDSKDGGQRAVVGMPDSGAPIPYLGAFSYDPTLRRLFVPIGRTPGDGGAAGRVVIFPLPNP